jgi:hypothetical protein
MTSGSLTAESWLLLMVVSVMVVSLPVLP